MESKDLKISPLPRDEGDQGTENGTERSRMLERASEEIEMSALPREEVDQEIETERSVMLEKASEETEEISGSSREECDREVKDGSGRSVKVEMLSESEAIQMSPQPREGIDQEREPDHDQEKNIEDYYESFEDKSFFETLQWQRDNFFEFPASEENTQTKEKRTRKDAIIAKVAKISPIALALFFMR